MATKKKATEKKATEKKATNTTKNTPTSIPKIWSDIRGIMRVWGQEYDDKVRYSTSVGKKDESGEYSNHYYNVLFAKSSGMEYDIEREFMIDVKKGFLSFNEGKNGVKYPSIVVMEFEFLEDEDLPQ